MGQNLGKELGQQSDEEAEEEKMKKKRKSEPKPDQLVSRYRRRPIMVQGPSQAFKLPTLPNLSSRLKHLKALRIKDWLALQLEFLSRIPPDHHLKDATDASKLIDEKRGSPLGVFNLEEFIGDDHAIVCFGGGTGEYYCRIHSMVNKDLLQPNCSVLIKTTGFQPVPSLFIVGVLPPEMESGASYLRVDKAPAESFRDIGGLEEQIEELKETVEMPLLQPELFQEMGIDAPRGVVMYGPPGTGKTLLAKAVANSTEATFIRVVGSELIQRNSGDGPKLVREIFRMADTHAPSIIFFDEIDAVGTKRYETNCGGEKEIQRTLLELLNQLDGFATRKDVKIIMATNQIETLDMALIRPGRIDRKIEIPNPSMEMMAKIFKIHTERMSLGKDVDFSAIFESEKGNLSGADIKAVCTEAGMLCLRDREGTVTLKHFNDAVVILNHKKQEKIPKGMYL